MGGASARCCGDRPRAAPKDLNGDKAARRESRRSLAVEQAFKQGSRSVNYTSGGASEDAKKFDTAIEKKDVTAFVELMASDMAIEPFEEKMHPWAEDAKDVGALAGVQLAVLASTDADDFPVRRKIRTLGAIPTFVAFLKSGKVDRVHTAIVALSFLTTDVEENAVAAFGAGAMTLLVPHMTSEIPGMRSSVATTLRNMYVAKPEYRDEFAKLDGARYLVEHLTPPPGVEDEMDAQLEAILNLQDFIDFESGDGATVIRKNADLVIKAGAKEKLKNLLKSGDEEVKEVAQEVLEALDG